MLMGAQFAKMCRFIIQKQKDNVVTGTLSERVMKINIFSSHFSTLTHSPTIEWE